MSDAPTTLEMVRWFARHKPVVAVAVTDTGDEQRVMVDQKAQKRWHALLQNLTAINACTVRLLDSKDNVLATRVLRVVDNGGAGSVSAIGPATSGGVDVAAIVHTVATAITTSVKEVIVEMQRAHAVSFAEMVNITKIATADASEFRKMVNQDLQDRREAIEVEREEREREFEEREAEREKEREEHKEFGEVGKMLLEMAGPELVKKFMNGKKELPHVDVAAKPVKDVPSGGGA